MKTGLESLDTGAPNITYSGNEGPKSPQENMQKMAEFELQEYMEEFERVFPDMKNLRGTEEYMNNLEDYFRGLASKQNEGIGNMATMDSSQQSTLEDIYERLLDTMSPEDAAIKAKEIFENMQSKQDMPSEMREMAAGGGIMGSNAGSMLVAPTKDGSRPGYAFAHAAGDLSSGKAGPGTGTGSTGDPGFGYKDRIQKIAEGIEPGYRQQDARPYGQTREVVYSQEDLKDMPPPVLDRTPKQEKPSFNVLNFIPGLGIAKKITNMLEPINKKFFVQKVLTSKNPQGYDEDDYEAYMAARMAGTIDAYGNPIGGNNDQQIISPSQIAMAPIITDSEVINTDTPTDTTPDTTDVVNRFAQGPTPFADYVGGIEIPTMAADGGRIGYKNGTSDTTPDTAGVISRVSPEQQNQIQGNQVAEQAYNEIMEKFINKFPGLATGEETMAEMIAMLQAEGVMGTENLGILGLDRAMDMITPESVRGSIPGVTRRMAQGGRIGYAGGGITDLRQGYFLGKLVKKAVRGVKKIAKSPIGKAAIMYAITGGLGNLAQGQSFLQNFGSPTSYLGGASNIFKKKGLKNIFLGGEKYSGLKSKNNLIPFSGLFGTGGKLNPFRAITALSSLPLFMGQEEEDNLDAITGQAVRGSGLDIAGIRKQALAGNLDRSMFPFMNPSYYAADGGRIGLAEGLTPRQAALNEMYEINNEDEEKKLALGGSAGLPPVTMMSEGQVSQSFSDDETPMPTQPDQMPRMNPMMARGMNPMMARGMNPMMNRGMPMMGGRMMAQEGGLMDMGGMEKDYRNEGGFVPIGGQERADDVPARLSKNEFVFTADAVRNAGGGDIDKGAEIMENMMDNLEQGGKVSKDSQGLSGAREMFATQKRLGEVL